MNRLYFYSVCLMLCTAFLSGCAQEYTRVDLSYGTAYELALASQLANPDAGVIKGAALGLDGEVAASVIERYGKGFQKPAPKTESYSVSTEGVRVRQ